MVGLVADILAIAVPWERYTEFHQLQKALRGERGFTERDVSIDAASGKECFRHLAYTVRVTAGQRQLVIGLLITSGLPAGATDSVFGHQGDIMLSQLPQTIRSIETGSTTADDCRVTAVYARAIHTGVYDTIFHVRLLYRRWMWNPPSTSM